MSGRRKSWRIAGGVAVLVLSLPAICLLDALRYPRIVRSAYLRHPAWLAKATWRRATASGGVSSRTVLAQARQTYPNSKLRSALLHLWNGPDDDKSVRDRLFGLVAKGWMETDEELFWVVSKTGGTMDDWLVYEYGSGKLVCWQR